MVDPIEFETERIFLRQWKPTDRTPFAALNSDLKVMEFFPALLTREESDATADRCESLINERGWGFWAAELKGSREFIGFVGLHTPSVVVKLRTPIYCWGKIMDIHILLDTAFSLTYPLPNI